MNMKVVFNADDFGYSKGANFGIVEAYQNGPVRSTTIMAGMPGFDHAVGLAKENPGLKIGVHLTLSTGKSVGGVYHTLTDEDGKFLPLVEVERRVDAGKIDLVEVEAEYEAQIKKVIAAGIKPDHFDSHHHTHDLPGVAASFMKIARKYGVKARLYNRDLPQGEYEAIGSTDAFDEAFYDDTATLADLRRMISGHKVGSLEIMCHPAYVDHEIYSSSSYNVKRAYELYVLTSPETMAFFAEQGVELCSFSDL